MKKSTAVVLILLIFVSGPIFASDPDTGAGRSGGDGHSIDIDKDPPVKDPPVGGGDNDR